MVIYDRGGPAWLSRGTETRRETAACRFAVFKLDCFSLVTFHINVYFSFMNIGFNFELLLQSRCVERCPLADSRSSCASRASLRAHSTHSKVMFVPAAHFVSG